ncbi:MAG: NAD(+)/NADH kinase [Treponema sp.]|nr:NAD(+)/NADH kinase [Treponema sp.]
MKKKSANTGDSVKRAILFVNIFKKNAAVTAYQIQGELEKSGFEAVIFSMENINDGKPQKPPDGKWDIAFSLGGDGTVLYAARCLAPLSVPILPVNLGTLGFIAGADMSNWLDVFMEWEKGKISLSRRSMLEVSVERNSKSGPHILMKNICLNDAVISSSGIAKLIKLGVQLSADNKQSASGGEIVLGAYRCDGLIISTPTGSTAYSMAAGGPILDPEMEAVILNPICPFALSNRPFVFPSRQPLSISVAQEQRTEVLLNIDGQDTFSLECTDKIIIKQAAQPALLISAGKQAYYTALRTKLFWSGDHSSAGDSNA